MKVAVENGIKTIAFPSISTGIYRFPVDKATKIAVSTVKQFLDENPGEIDEVTWVLFDNNTLDVYRKEIELLNQ